MQSGPEQLKDWMHRRRFLQREAAEYLGWHETYISQLLTGARTPGLDNAVHIERQTGIPIEAWTSTDLDTAAVGAAPKPSKSRNTKA